MSATATKIRFWRRFLAESEFLRDYLRRYRKLVVIGLLALILVDALEIIPPILLKNAIDVVANGARAGTSEVLGSLAAIAGIYFGVALVQSFGRYGWRMYLLRSSILAGQDVRSDFAHRLFDLPMSFYDRTPIGDLMSLATSDVDAIRQALGPGILVFADAIFYFISVPLVMYWMSPKLTLLAFVSAPLIPWLVLRNEREIHSRYEALQESFGELSSLAQEGLTGIRVVKAFASEKTQVARLRAAGDEYVRKALRLARVQAAFGPTLDFTMSLGLVLLLYFGGRLVGAGASASAATAITLGTFVAFQRYIQKMVWPMAAIGMAVSFYQRAVTSGGRIKAIIEEKNDVIDVPEPQLPSGWQATGWKTPGGVRFARLSFRFPGTEKHVLEDVSITIDPGERVAFVGTVGAGKSALLSLLPRLYPVERGMLFVDGVDVRLWPVRELREQVGYVSQDVFLFSETVRENVAYGIRDWQEARDPGPLEEATRLAAVHEDVLGLVGSYQTRLGERGVNLSGGQKQRLSIARAIAKRPPILVLDDALSSVDVRTEEEILAGLRARPGRNTEIIAAHRISTVRDADRIVVLERGRIAEIGTHAELVARRSGAYFRFYEEQRLRADLESYAEVLDQRLERGGAVSASEDSLDAYLDVEERESRRVDRGALRAVAARVLEHRGPFAGGLLMILLGTVAALAEPRLFGYAIDEAIVPQRWKLLDALVLGYLGLIALRVAAMIAQAYLFEMLGQRLTQRLRCDLYAHMQRLPVAVYDKNPAGRLLTRVTNDIASLSEMFSAGFVSMVGNALMVIGTCIGLVLLDARLGLITLTVFPALVWVSVYFSGRLKLAYREARSKLSALNAFLAENLMGMKVVHLFNRDRLHLERFDRINRWYGEALIGTVRIFAMFQPSITLASGIAVSLLIVFGGKDVLQGRLHIGVLVAYFSYVLSIFQPLREIADKWNIFLSGMTSAERIFSILGWEEEGRRDVVRPKILGPGLQLRGHIEFRGVWFAYSGEHWVLKDFNLDLKPGMRVGIVGHTGAGKTTLISLLLRFYEPQKGQILIDGRDIREYDRGALRAAIGIVQQDVFLFSGSVEENVTFWGAGGAEATARARETMDRLGFGRLWESRGSLQERGSNLSMGERQVLAFVRAAAVDPSLWVLDEATANMDSSSEKELQAALSKASGGRTMLVIAHRLATVQDADRILVLHKGVLVEQGTHRELLRAEGLYSRIYRYQRAASDAAVEV